MTAPDLKAKYEAQRVARYLKYGNEVELYYNQAINAAAEAAARENFLPGVFKLSKYPALNKKIDAIISKLNSQINVLLVSAIKNEWNKADQNNDELFDTVLKRNGKRSKLLNGRNDDALEQFLNRKNGKGLNLSKKIYQYTGQYKQELETGLADGIAYGKSAREMAADLNSHLKEPDKLFRRVRKNEKLTLSKKALEYKPGQGVYRSSYKNILRLTRTETNIAYRTADHERYKKSPFIIGVKVSLSNRHPQYDICDNLVGTFASDYKHIGFHAQCLCYATPILLSPSEFDQMETDSLNGKDISKISYTDKPKPTGEHAKIWWQNNKNKFANHKSPPMFLDGNRNLYK